MGWIKARRLVFGFVVVLVACFPQSMATSVRALNLFDMLELADRVFWGVCVSVQERTEAGLPPVLEYVFEVRRAIKGAQRGEKIVFRQVQARQRGKLGIAGLPHYGKGELALLFLHPDSRLGLTSPVGLAQGVFRLRADGDGATGFVNALANRNLHYGLRGDEATASGLSRTELVHLESSGPVAVETFFSMIEKVDRYQALRSGSAR